MKCFFWVTKHLYRFKLEELVYFRYSLKTNRQLNTNYQTYILITKKLPFRKPIEKLAKTVINKKEEQILLKLLPLSSKPC